MHLVIIKLLLVPEVIKIDNNQVNLIINIDKKEISKIKNIYFIGNKFFSSSQLLDVISSNRGWMVEILFIFSFK